MNKYFITKFIVLRYDSPINIEGSKEAIEYTFQIILSKNNPGIEISSDGRKFRRFYYNDKKELVPYPWVDTLRVDSLIMKNKNLYEFETDEDALLFSEVLEE